MHKINATTSPPKKLSDQSKHQQDDQDLIDKTQNSTRVLAPSPAVRPGWNRNNEHDHEYNQ